MPQPLPGRTATGEAASDVLRLVEYDGEYDVTGVPSVSDLAAYPDGDWPVGDFVLLDGTDLYRACDGEWTRVPTGRYAIVAEGPSFAGHPGRWDGYTSRDVAETEARQLARSFGARLVNELSEGEYA